ncbi:DeoR/GlpR family DNA-binding transcription regulator [Ferruginibacter paludis]|uniref:DeoR/GlpR family DNA-binding transcription regulator n=1 Tax=Ferruginibacter paludis TaxID=1310417 RepID=UPI0025B2A66D|nr:DeoR/GlpR family DNA-binding transcription regulator [Ferruginibacter paludis]MDN3659424.1 DeoR/GlpR family DNA-binding transcription regulator [Ferruginibacter paludis]
MLKEERHKIILREVNLHNKVLTSDLSELLDVSEDTIRRDLNELDELEMILKVHGGAMSKTFHYPFNGQNPVYALEAKKLIAQKAITLFKKDMLILIEGGTTIMEIAKQIPTDLHATFLTVCPQVALALAEHENIDVITIGGRLAKNANIHTGASVINELAGIKTDLCIIGTNGISVEDGLTDSDWEVVQVMKAMIRSAKKTATVCIAEKFNTVQKIKIADLTDVDYVITELDVNNPMLDVYRGEGKPELM